MSVFFDPLFWQKRGPKTDPPLRRGGGPEIRTEKEGFASAPRMQNLEGSLDPSGGVNRRWTGRIWIPVSGSKFGGENHPAGGCHFATPHLRWGGGNATPRDRACVCHPPPWGVPPPPVVAPHDGVPQSIPTAHGNGELHSRAMGVPPPPVVAPAVPKSGGGGKALRGWVWCHVFF